MARLTHEQQREYEEEVEYHEKHHPSEKLSTVERIKRAAQSTGRQVGGAVNKFVSNPTVQKAGHIIKERAEVFQENISPGGRAQPSQRQPRGKKPKSSRQSPRAQPPQRSAAQDNPFGVGVGGFGRGERDDPMAAGLNFGGKRFKF